MRRVHTAALLGILALTMVGAKHGSSSTGETTELSGSLRIIGSNTVTPVSTAWAEAFMKLHPKVNISISGPGSGPGIAAIIDNTTDIGQASRAMRPQEYERAQERGVQATESIIAWDGLAIVINKGNPIQDLTMDQLARIYRGEVTNWKEVGGRDARIVAASRDTASGTHAFFKEFVLENKEFTPRALFLASTSAGVTEVSRNRNAIFYAGLGYVTPDVKVVGVKKDAAAPAVKPSVASVNDKSYPLARPLFYYTDGEPSGITKAFLEFGWSKAGAQLVEKLGFVPLP